MVGKESVCSVGSSCSLVPLELVAVRKEASLDLFVLDYVKCGFDIVDHLNLFKYRWARVGR